MHCFIFPQGCSALIPSQKSTIAPLLGSRICWCCKWLLILSTFTQQSSLGRYYAIFMNESIIQAITYFFSLLLFKTLILKLLITNAYFEGHYYYYCYYETFNCLHITSILLNIQDANIHTTKHNPWRDLHGLCLVDHIL